MTDGYFYFIIIYSVVQVQDIDAGRQLLQMIQQYGVHSPYGRVLFVPDGFAAEIEQTDGYEAVAITHKAKCGRCQDGIGRYGGVYRGYR